MSEKKKKVPGLRFPGFSGEWEERKLGDLGSVAMNKRIYKDQTTETGDVPFYKIGTFGSAPDAFISRELFEEYKAKYPYPVVGDILISASGSIGRTVEYKGGDEYFQDSNIVWLQHDKTLDNSFLKQFYSIVKWRGLEGSTIKRLYNKNILDTEIIVPELEEQEKIGAFFKQLDHLITLHQRQLTHLQTRKKGLLQQMFPKDGELFPELRFPGFTDAWEVRKLGDVTNSFSGGTPSVGKSSYYNGEIPFIRSAEINSKSTELFISQEGLNSSSAKIVNVGDILYALYGATSGEVGIAQIEGAINQAILAIQPKENYASQFIMQWLGGQKQRIIDRFLQGGQGNLSGSIVKDLLIEFPKYQEQQKIGAFFKQLDDSITLHQRKLDHLQDRKKALLQQMFV